MDAAQIEPVFGRSGHDLTVTVPVTFAQLALGAEIKVPSPGGGQLTKRIPAGTRNGQTFRLPGMGVRRMDGTSGSLLVTVEVMVPQYLTGWARSGLALGGAQDPGQRRKTTPGSGSLWGSGDLAVGGPAPGENSSGLVKVTIYLLRDGNAESRAEAGHQSRRGARFLIKQEIVTGQSQADLAEMASIRAEYERADVSKDRGEMVREATADYFGKQIEDKLNISWWETRESFPLSSAAEELNKSADWLRGLVAGPLAKGAHAAGVAGPVSPIFVGITANLATQRLTEPPENAALTCEVAGTVVGLATGNLPLVVACAKPLAHDLLGKAFAQTFEWVLDESGPENHKMPEDDIDEKYRKAVRKFKEMPEPISYRIECALEKGPDEEEGPDEPRVGFGGPDITPRIEITPW